MQFSLKAASGSITGQRFTLQEDTRIGSAEQAGIRIEGLQSTHARIIFDGTTLTLEAAGPVWVNGEPVERQALKSGDELRLGEQRFVLQAPGLRPPSVLKQAAPRRSHAWLWVTIGLGAVGAASAAAYFYWPLW